MDQMTNKMERKVKIPWVEDKETFIASIQDGEWIVTVDYELHLLDGFDGTDDDVRDRFLIYGLGLHHTTDWLRFFCKKYHPEIDFDKEFETDQPGVFGKYQEKFGHDYEEDVNQQIFNELEKSLSEKGYSLPWE